MLPLQQSSSNEDPTLSIEEVVKPQKEKKSRKSSPSSSISLGQKTKQPEHTLLHASADESEELNQSQSTKNEAGIREF
jgi:hypothetical protein